MAKKSQSVGRTSKFNYCLTGKDTKNRRVYLEDEKMRKIRVILRIINSTAQESVRFISINYFLQVGWIKRHTI